ncbi:NAD-binding protein [Mycena indigotica]|uniref:NAD-binding protein n=1 Tax=Mycena indigotica TaxID=2126181 RepID=A0A8H6SQZ1_9AGAR|nr:NAD-binding protein [Mycena indigotica]KAF7303593.1 NAD-binding protein [Mycena indigotica]
MVRLSSRFLVILTRSVQTPPIEELTMQGYDLQFGTNVLGHFYLTTLLLPTLIATAKQEEKPARIIHTASVAAHHWGEPNIRYDTVTPGVARNKLGKLKLYWQSKFANAVFSNELHRRYESENIISVSVNPGNLRTQLARSVPSVPRMLANIFLLYPQANGALTQLWAGTTDEGLKLSGKFLFPWARLGVSPTEESGSGAQLWAWCEEAVTKFNDNS